MAYTLTQARGLLTVAELELFEQSRAEPIKALSAARLRGKVARARKLRDKYRDLYRRQSVATRAAPAARRSAVGVDNERTQRKAVIFGEVLGRFEARLQLLEARLAREAARKAGAVKKTTVVRKAGAVKKVAPVRKAGVKKAPSTSLAQAVKRAVKLKAVAPAPAPAKARSAKAPAAHASRAQAKAAPAKAPLDVAAKAERLNPLKKKAGNVAIHAHASARGRRGQARRDSR